MKIIKTIRSLNTINFIAAFSIKTKQKNMKSKSKSK